MGLGTRETPNLTIELQVKFSTSMVKLQKRKYRMEYDKPGLNCHLEHLAKETHNQNINCVQFKW